MTTGEPVWQEVECGCYRADLDIWRELASQQQRDGPCRLLDLGCGTGRVSLALAADRCQVTALDSEPELVAELRRRAASTGVVLDSLVADARSFDLGRRFDLVLAPMQLVQLMETRAQRRSLLASVARHLETGGRAALALLDFDEEWVAEPAEAPLPDVLQRDGWVFSSQPVAVRERDRGRSIELERIRKAVSPAGELSEQRYTVRLAVVSGEALEREASDAGLVAHPRLIIPPTPDHVGSTVVVLGADA
jgi:SAM-dependent methyltransferase